MESKTITLRIDADRADEIDAIAQANGTSSSETIRTAIDEMIANARSDKAFQARLKESIARNQKVLERLSK